MFKSVECSNSDEGVSEVEERRNGEVEEDVKDVKGCAECN